MLRVEKYQIEFKSQWDDFVLKSKNATFLLLRDYMEYHSDRFQDASLLFFNDDQLIALMGANISDSSFISHAGLTYGGLVLNEKIKANVVLEVFDLLIENLKKQGVREIIYKPIPHVYHRIPAEEDLYALFRRKANLFRRDISSTIDLKNQVKFSSGRLYQIKKGKKEGLEVRKSDDFESYWTILSEGLLSKYNKKPVHSLEEITNLSAKFPQHIELFCCYRGKELLGGMLMYNHLPVAHVQYMASTEIGKELGALDMVTEFLLSKYSEQGYRYFDFGISTEEEGTFLNEGLIANKESYGARAVVYDQYRIELQ